MLLPTFIVLVHKQQIDQQYKTPTFFFLKENHVGKPRAQDTLELVELRNLA